MTGCPVCEHPKAERIASAKANGCPDSLIRGTFKLSREAWAVHVGHASGVIVADVRPNPWKAAQEACVVREGHELSAVEQRELEELFRAIFALSASDVAWRASLVASVQEALRAQVATWR
jgi:hypothetical protein